MQQVVRTERHQRGAFGWFFRIVFWTFNVAMAAWVIAYWVELSNQPATSHAAEVGKTVGGAIGTAAILFFWVCGAVIFGLLSYFTKGRRTIVETVET